MQKISYCECCGCEIPDGEKLEPNFCEDCDNHDADIHNCANCGFDLTTDSESFSFGYCGNISEFGQGPSQCDGYQCPKCGYTHSW